MDHLKRTLFFGLRTDPPYGCLIGYIIFRIDFLGPPLIADPFDVKP